ncbi:MAG: 50S ribosome-binding GTPase [Nanoarchaeota archaeon]|nr:50S ribosome-binding GTPase [Nanoarchaeota archaeon]
MASTNQSPFYHKAEEKFLSAGTDEERIKYLEEMIKECPKHKSSEKMLAQLRTRYKKLLKKIEGAKRFGKASKEGIKKEGVQTIILGKTNVGKSSLITLLTNVHTKISEFNFATKKPVVGMLKYKGIEFQLIENPAIESEYYDRGLTHTADIILMMITNLSQIEELKENLGKGKFRKIVVFNKSDLLSEKEKRKISATLQSKKHNFILISTITKEGIDELKSVLLENSGKIRVFTKEPGKGKTERPIILNPGSTVKEISEKILHGFSRNIKETRIWGPSSKFPGQIVGLTHKLKDLDTVEFKTK